MEELFCSKCGAKINYRKAQELLKEYGYSFKYLREPLCAECLDDMIYNNEQGFLIIKCADCGCFFDPMEEMRILDRKVIEEGGNIPYEGVIYQEKKHLCAACASKYIHYDPAKARPHFYDGWDDDEDDDDEDYSERVPLHEAALYWLSSGFDPDEMYGYTEEELREELRNG